jgi:hypothetical protein
LPKLNLRNVSKTALTIFMGALGVWGGCTLRYW